MIKLDRNRITNSKTRKAQEDNTCIIMSNAADDIFDIMLKSFAIAGAITLAIISAFLIKYWFF
jgi:hypothetical protein